MADEDTKRIEQAAIVAHQIKSPVSSLQTILRTLLGGFAGEMDERQKALLQSADRKCSEAMDTIKGLLALAEASGHETDREAADLIGIVLEVCERYRPAAIEKRIEFSRSIDADQAWVRAHPPGLLEAVAALVDNAVKYTPEGGCVAVRVAETEGGRASLSVSDSGIGVPEREWSGLFRPFFRAGNARRLLPAGTGLGLAFVRAIVQSADGTISAHRSELGGMEFVAELPRIAKPAGAGTAQRARAREPRFRAVVIGGVAAGPKIAAKVMRLAPDAYVTIVEKGHALSYAGCGLPYYIAGRVKDQSQLQATADGVVRGPEYFERVKNVHVMHRTEALEIDRANKRVRIRELIVGQESWLPYDKLAIATGAVPVVPAIPGVDLQNVFTLHGLAHAEGVRSVVSHGRAADVTIVGGGLIGVEMTDSLVEAGCRVTLVELQPQLMPSLDWEMAEQVRKHFEARGVRVMVSTRVAAFEGTGKVERVVTEAGSWPADVVIMGVGVRPNSRLALAAGLELSEDGGIEVDEHMRTSDPDIYAAGDCVSSRCIITGHSIHAPFGGTANRQGRVAAENICGGDALFPGVLCTALCKIFDLTVARTGLTEKDAGEMGCKPVAALVPALDCDHFMPHAAMIMVKLIADADTRKLLGMQAIGPGDVAKRLDVAVTALAAGMTVDDLANLDLGYAPPYATAMGNLHTAANVIKNKLAGQMVGLAPQELRRKLDAHEPIVLLDVRTHGQLEERPFDGTIHIPLPVLRAQIDEVPRDREIVVYSRSSLSAYEAAIILRDAGFKDVQVLDGGLLMWPYD